MFLAKHRCWYEPGNRCVKLRFCELERLKNLYRRNVSSKRRFPLKHLGGFSASADIKGFFRKELLTFIG